MSEDGCVVVMTVYRCGYGCGRFSDRQQDDVYPPHIWPPLHSNLIAFVTVVAQTTIMDFGGSGCESVVMFVRARWVRGECRYSYHSRNNQLQQFRIIPNKIFTPSPSTGMSVDDIFVLRWSIGEDRRNDSLRKWFQAFVIQCNRPWLERRVSFRLFWALWPNQNLTINSRWRRHLLLISRVRVRVVSWEEVRTRWPMKNRSIIFFHSSSSNTNPSITHPNSSHPSSPTHPLFHRPQSHSSTSIADIVGSTSMNVSHGSFARRIKPGDPSYLDKTRKVSAA